MKKFFFFSIFPFGQVNYIFHKLSVDTKHVQFWLHISPWWSFVQNGFLVHFSYTFWEAPTCSCVAETAQGLKGKVLKNSLFCSLNLDFSLFFHLFFVHDFAQCYLQCNHYDLNVKFFIFFKKFHSVEVLSQDPHQQKVF